MRSNTETLLHKTLSALALLVIAASCPLRAAVLDQMSAELDWPVVTKEHRPWVYWWWMGSAVDQAELTRHLDLFSQAGLGGAHIIPIYGAEGYEDRYIAYLSPKWMEMLAHTVAEAKRVGMGIDMSCGTGWPFGGPNVKDEDADSLVVPQTFQVQAGGGLETKLDKPSLQKLMAYSDGGEIVELTDKLDGNGRLNWTAPPGRWELYAVSQSAKEGRKVKRAAPGGEGNSINSFSRRALRNYLTRFDAAFAGYKGGLPRAFYHDSYEYAGNWSDEIWAEFQKRRGYPLQNHLPALFGKGPQDQVTRVRADFRATMADMLLENLIVPWVKWCHAKGSLARNQAHGSPGNILDLYAAADIPETEAFGTSYIRYGGLELPLGMWKCIGGHEPDPMVNKMASSAAHVADKPRVACEAFTWLSDHFRVSLAEAKAAIDVLFTLGVNHMTYHGMTYSPKSAGWPGWLFYAETNFGPYNTFWREMPAFHGYIARCQSFLQAGRPDNDVLLYFPIHDIWSAESDPPGLLRPLQVHNSEQWLNKHARGCHLAATLMWDLGYSCDYVSDTQIRESLSVSDGLIKAKGSSYRVIVLPACKFIETETLSRILDLARDGACVLAVGQLPADVPGLGDLEKRRELLKRVLAEMQPNEDLSPGVRQRKAGKGRILTSNNLQVMLEHAGVRREEVVDSGVEFIRRSTDNGWIYFLFNPGRRSVDQSVRLSVPAASVVLYDPLSGKRGLADVQQDGDGVCRAYVQLEPGQSIIVRALKDRRTGPAWSYAWMAGKPAEITGDWRVEFIEGGPSLPPPITIRDLSSWTGFGKTDSAAVYRAFSGTARYTITFDKPGIEADDWLLDLGRVCHTARVKLNGQSLGTLFSHPFCSRLGEALKEGPNHLELEVTNLAANRIIDMEQQKELWCKYLFMYVNRAHTGPGDWHPFPSGLLGPLRLIPLRLK